MALNANEFILQGFSGGQDPAAGLSHFAGQLWNRNIQNQRLELARQQRKSQAGNFLQNYLDPKDYLTGTAYDPVINTGLQHALEQGAALAEQGANIPELITSLSPMMRQLTDYSTKARTINKQADDVIKTMKESGMMGYDYSRLKDQALRSAFHNFDPKTGQDIGLRNIDEIDPSTNWVMKTLQEHPEQVTTAEGLDQYVKAYPQVKNSTDATTYTPTGTMTRNKVNMVGQGYLVPEVDNNGVVTGLVPSYEHATDQGQPIQHEFVDANGQRVKAPVRLLDEGYFNEAVSHKGVGDWLRGQVRQHLKEYSDKTGKPIDLNSVQAHQVARSILYDELKRRSPGSIQFQDVIDKPSAAQIQVRVYGDKEQQSYDRETGRINARLDKGLPASGRDNSEKPLNAVETLHQIFKKNENYLGGQIENKNGRDVIDVTSHFKNATLKFGKGQDGTYAGVYFDPEKRSLLLDDGTMGVKEIPEKDLKDFAKNIAGANNINSDWVETSFKKAGWNNKAGRYSDVGDAPQLQGRYIERQNSRNARINKGLDNLVTNGKSEELVGLLTPKGKITKVGTPFWGTGYKITYIDSKGKEQTEKFENRQQIEQFIKGASQDQQEQDILKEFLPSK